MKLRNFFVIIFILSLFFNISASYADSNDVNISAESAVLIDSSSEKVLFSKDAERKMYPASTTKILTAILAIENCNLDDVVTVPYEAISQIPSGYSVAELQAGEQITVEQLLKVMMVHSANDAANVLAYHVSGSLEGFAGLMNQKIADLGLEHTHFTNPSGMQNENHYTTAHDLSLIMKYCMKNSTFRTLAGLKSCIIPATNKYEERIFKTTNDLLISDNRDVQSNYYYRYAIAGKTGYTTEAKNCLVSVANKDGFELICVVLGVGVIPNNLSGKFLDTKNLFEYGYNNYAIKKIRDKNAIATQITISNATKETQNLDLLLSDDITVLTSQNASESNFSPTITLKDNLFAPIAQGQVLGKITYTVDGVDYSSDLIAANNVELSSSYVFAIQIVLIVIILFLLYKLLFGGNNKTKNYKRKSFRLFK